MNLLEKLNHIFILKNDLEREHAIGEIGDIFEFGDVEKEEVIEVVNSMLTFITQDISDSLKESILNAINNALVYKNVGVEISFDMLIPYLTDLNKAHLSYVLTFFGFSGDAKYKPLLEKYSICNDAEIREAAQEALYEIDSRIKKEG
ncbi:hypothetical protein [Paenibacillus campi]|uniref:hypothetical protein n=1 Tax=Paenibacillus campi TaxID=3106031 RepID=UPI002AFF0BA0|nr:hypothetical protein [Paenibacillus sp. SGZ-1014]